MVVDNTKFFGTYKINPDPLVTHKQCVEMTSQEVWNVMMWCLLALQVQRSSIVAAGALVTPGTTVPTGEIWAGRPAKLLREMAEGEAAFIEQSAINYSALADIHADENAKTAEEVQVQATFACSSMIPATLAAARRSMF